MTTEEMKNAVRAEVERRYQEQNLNAMCELYPKIKQCLLVSDDRVANNNLDYGCWMNIVCVLSQIEKHPDWKEVFHDEIERLERNKVWFIKREQELGWARHERESELPWWKSLFGKKR